MLVGGIAIGLILAVVAGVTLRAVFNMGVSRGIEIEKARSREPS